MTEQNQTAFSRLVSAITQQIEQARGQVRQAVNTAMVQSYWEIGRLIVEHEQQGNRRAEYGKQQLKQLSQQLTERLGKAAGEIKLPGFGPGKVPMKEVRRRYGPAVRAEVAGELMQASFVDAVRSEELSPAGAPNLEVVKMDPGIDFDFTATF